METNGIGVHLPAVVTLDDLAAMNRASKYGHRFELSPEGALSVTPLPDSEHAAVASRLVGWLAIAGWPPEQLLQAAGIRLAGPEGSGGRIPDLTVWARPQPPSTWLPLADLLLVVEIVSPGSKPIDELVKLREYARAGIRRYWMVDRDVAQTVTLHLLGAGDTYEVAAKMPLAWLLRTPHLPTTTSAAEESQPSRRARRASSFSATTCSRLA
ncbi:Uma2 family endonuclease [Actinoplanes sp. ATCC 53533]|uniref:Uma2 family endonuclease n=1 Tax=Actinoplanes sp. ATCC 53533 TaxID=1288362 RepID=UPI001F34D3B3|nr:Uma2 family endonuclease [Actinoplanes sp. ATCC 53533]